MRDSDSAAEVSAALTAVRSPSFLRKLDRLRLSVRQTGGTRPGNTPVRRVTQPSGIELENYRQYAAGDDPRHLDWNVYGRLDQLLVKLFRGEREVPLQVILDASASMGVPAADQKFPFALALAASLAYVSLRNHDPVRIIALSEAWPARHVASPMWRHVTGLERLMDFLTTLAAGGSTALDSGLTAALRTSPLSGNAVVVSDFLVEPDVYQAALDALVARRLTVTAIRVIGPAERDPTRQFRRAQVCDAETGRTRFVTLTPANVARYEDALTAHLARLHGFCRQRGVSFTLADTARGIERSLFHDLPAQGILY